MKDILEKVRKGFIKELKNLILVDLRVNDENTVQLFIIGGKQLCTKEELAVMMTEMIDELKTHYAIKKDQVYTKYVILAVDAFRLHYMLSKDQVNSLYALFTLKGY